VTTAVAHWDVTEPPDSDAELARASAAGDKRAFAQIYDRYADRLYDFCAGMLADRDGAADCVQDVFCIAATELAKLRDADRLRPWLYSIARNEALRRIRQRRRETPSEELPETESGEPGPETLATRLELGDLIAEAAGGLSDRDRAVLELAFRHGLNGPDLAEALGVTPSNANTIVHRLRTTIERSLGALLVARQVRTTGECDELATILDGWDGHFNVLVRKRISRHIESCHICDGERRRLVTPAALLGVAPVFIPAPEWLRERTLGEIQLTSATRPSTDDASRHENPNSLLPITAFVVALLAALGLTFAWWNMQKTTIETPIKVSEASAPPSAPPNVEPPAQSPSVSAQPVTPSRPAPPAPRTVGTPPPSAEPTVVAPQPTVVAPPPVSEPPTVSEPPISEPTPAPPLLPPPPPDWTEWLPAWPIPSAPPQPPAGGFTGPGGLAVPPPGGSVVP
jgi:RNA polymerase sigma factor (sigma-70 family)